MTDLDDTESDDIGAVLDVTVRLHASCRISGRDSHSRRWRGQVIISTGTKALQDQLHFRELLKVRLALRAL